MIGAMACLFAACKPNVAVTTKLTQGEADFTNYLAIGNSLTAGYADGTLSSSGQLNSYPQRLFEQFQLVTNVKGTFVQPLLPGNYGYPNPKKVLAVLINPCTGDTSLGAVNIGYALDSGSTSAHYVSTVANEQINNIAVPGIRAIDYLVDNYAIIAQGAGYPYAMRFYNNPAGTPLQELQYRVNNLHPTFFTMWLGSNDVLGFALAGGQGDGTGNALPLGPNFYNKEDITPYTTFDTAYDRAVNMAISTGAKGALINIPDIASLPFFTTIPINGLNITRQSMVDSLQALWGPVTKTAVFQLGANQFMVTDHNGRVRQSIPGELIMLSMPMDNIKCKGWGITVPIPKEYVITTEELQQIRSATKSYNDFIKYETTIHPNLAYVDMHTFMGSIATGYTYNGIKYTTEYVTGGAFSLDGIHPTPRGYALIANEIIRTINARYKSNMPLLEVNKYHGVDFP
jgi:lysophospholipase L1-like esterase